MEYFAVRTGIAWWAASMALLINEWLFQITKPSFFTRFPPLRTVAVALNAGLALSVFILGVFVVVWTIATFNKNQLVQKIILLGPPAGLISITLLLMVDNFTGTVFGFNMGAATGFWRFTYVILLLSLFIEAFRHIRLLLIAPWSMRVQRSFYGVAGLLIVLWILSVSVLKSESTALAKIPVLTETSVKPNIFILSTDGLNASNMSAYGYPRPTTPFLESLANETLRFEDHFANASHTTGSIVALLSGRFPTSTRVIYRPDILTGKDAFLHLPGILRQFEYHNYDVSLEYYADPYDLNLRQSFHSANARREQYVQFGQILPLSAQIKYDIEIYFLENLAQRIVKRLAHVFGFKDLENPYFRVTHLGGENRLDENTVAEVKSLLHGAPQPFFLHAHLLGTHGPKFGPPTKVFSAGQVQSREWMTDFYDDAVLAFDSQVKILLDDMRQQNILDNTIVIITSDHGRNFSPDRPVPLIIRLPGGVRSGVVRRPTQQIDIAPTLLDLLEIAVPSWMDGQSLLTDHYRKRPIFSVYPAALGAPQSGWREAEDYYAPYFSLGGLSVIADGTWCGLSLRDNRLACRQLKSISSYPQKGTLNEKSARKAIIEHLGSRGYDVTTYNRDAGGKQ